MAKNFTKSKRPMPVKTRKQIRKEQRQLKKIKRNEYYLNKNKPKQETNEAQNIDVKSPSKKVQKTPANNFSSLNRSTAVEKQMKERHRETIRMKKLQKDMKLERVRQLEGANEDEDKTIRRLEKKLKLNRRKSKSLPKSFVAEGLDYLLEVCDHDKYKDSINLEKELHEMGHDFEDDFAVVTGSSKTKSKDSRELSDDEEVSDENSEEVSHSEEDESSDEELSSPKPSKKRVTFNLKNEKRTEKPAKQDLSARMKKLQEFMKSESSRNSESDTEKDEDSNDDDESANNSDSGSENSEDGSRKRKKSSSENKSKKFKEDIYGRLRDEEGRVVENPGKYVPPHLRARPNSIPENSELLQRLTKQMKSLLNRLTENNMHSIATEMENLYMKNSRNDTNHVFIQLLSESLVTSVLSPERFVIEHALLISVLHANVGTEIGAYILQHFVEKLHKMLKEDIPVENKCIDNTIALLSHLYNFKIFHACLIYEILYKLVDRFREKDVELILSVLRSVGFSLRKDDPAALKELICRIQKKANESTELRESSRVRFMLDILLAVKNNNMLKIPNYNPDYVEHLKKIQKSLLRHGKYVSELNISMEDLLNADSKGRWWIVGSAWSGDLKRKSENKGTNDVSETVSFDSKILALARKNRMNTDTRRNIFCILMTAEDYIDAFEKLTKLGLKGQQSQEIINVLMHCLMKEKSYNPYYVFIAEQFCTVDRKYQLAIQFSVWDKFKEINSCSNQQVTILAKFLSYLFVELKLPLSILKVLQFTEMTKPMVKLIRQIMLAILLSENESLVVDVFSRISKSEKLFMLREGLQLFLHHFILKNIETSEDYGEKLNMLPKRVEVAVNAMTSSSSNEF